MTIPTRQKVISGRHAFVDGIRYEMPIRTSDASAIMAAFPCNFDSARSLLPEGFIQPYRLWNRAILLVTVIDYRETNIGSYIEYSIAVACTYGLKPRMRLIPALFMKLFGTGQYVLDLPVSTEISVKGGQGIWGMPKHQANLDFIVGRKWISSQYDLDGQMVGRLDIKRPTRYGLSLNMAATNYCAFRGMMMRSRIYFKSKVGVSLIKPQARFVLGSHPRTDALSSLNIAAQPLFVVHMPQLTGVLDDYFDCWFISSLRQPSEAEIPGLETTYPLGYSEDWLQPPKRDPYLNLDED